MKNPKVDEYLNGWCIVMLLALTITLVIMFVPRDKPKVDWSGHEQVIQQWMEAAKHEQETK